MTAILRHVAVEAALATLFPPTVAVAAEAITADRTLALWPEERADIAGAVPARQAEFAAGRTAARRCLAALGREPVGLSIGKDRAAVWPQGVFGSISHANGFAVAVASLDGPIGVDLEVDAAIEPELWPLICGADELERQPSKDPGRWVRHIFAAKEAVFKAQMPDDRVMFGFDSVQVTLAGNDFVALYLKKQGRFAKGAEVRGRLAFVSGMVLAGVLI